MKEHPILFSTPMVQAILAGKKKMTRRIILPQPPEYVRYMDYYNGLFRAYMEMGEPCAAPGSTEPLRIKYKYAIGDRLWVREKAQVKTHHYGPGKDYVVLLYESDNNLIETEFPKRLEKPDLFPSWVLNKKKCPYGIFKEAARIFLTITDLKGERLQDISEEDARAEGVDPYPGMGKIGHVHSFYKLWEKLNAKRGWGWDINPMTVAISFEIAEVRK
jgi:hypothetical protein